MNLDMSQLSVPELTDLRKQVERTLKIRIADERKAAQRETEEKRRNAVKQIRDLVSAFNLDVGEVIAQGTRRRRGEGERVTGPKSPPKYRNPFNTDQTWTGKGRKPGWLLSLLQQGKSLDELAA